MWSCTPGTEAILSTWMARQITLGRLLQTTLLSCQWTLIPRWTLVQGKLVTHSQGSPVFIDILEKIHSRHQGLTKCLARAKHSVWWPGIYKQLMSDLIMSCKESCKHRTQHSETLMPTKLVDYPWHTLIHMEQHKLCSRCWLLFQICCNSQVDYCHSQWCYYPPINLCTSWHPSSLQIWQWHTALLRIFLNICKAIWF